MIRKSESARQLAFGLCQLLGGLIHGFRDHERLLLGKGKILNAFVRGGDEVSGRLLLRHKENSCRVTRPRRAALSRQVDTPKA